MSGTVTYMGKGISLDYTSGSIDIVLPDKDRNGHFWCFGTTRVGKTRVMENMIEQDIRKGNSVIVIDPKGDAPLFSKIVQVAFEEKRHEELILVSAIFPDMSARIDPLSHFFMPEELVGHIVSGVDVGKEPFFFNVAYEISLAIVQSLLMLAKFQNMRPNFNLNEVMNYIDRDEIATLKSQIDSIDSPEAVQLGKNLGKILNSPPDYFSKISSTLRVALVELCSGNIGQIIGKADENRFISRLEEGKKVIMVVQLGSLLTRKAAFTLGKVTVSMIQSYVGRIFSSDKKIDPPLALYIDEAQNVLYKGIEDLFAKAGGAGCWIHGFAQSVSQMYAVLGKDFAKAILDNANTKLFMRVPDTETAEYVAPHFGIKRTKESVTAVGGSVSNRTSTDDVVMAQDVLNLAPREFFMLTYGGSFKGKTNDISDLYLEIKFPDIGQVG